MCTHLKERDYYKDLYDHHTVESGSSSAVQYDNFLVKFRKEIPKDDSIERPGNAVVANLFYMQAIGGELLHRYEERDGHITEWMARDKAKDEQIASARLAEEPHCQHCGKTGLRIIDKSLMHRRERDYATDKPEEVLIMLRCPHCDKNSAFWQDGTPWEPKPTLCSKCQFVMTEKAGTRSKNAVTFTYTCPSCGHSYKDKMDLSDKKEQPDPDYEKDRTHYCLHDKEFRDRLFEIRRGFEGMAALGKKFKEKEDNRHIYDAIKEMKRPKIAELVPLLSEPLEKAGFIELHLDKPEMGKDVYVGFSCLDGQSDRDDYDSKKALKKLVEQTLGDTNWRLMSDGISYRLGYLNGRLRAYEREEDLKTLVAKRAKAKPAKKNDTSDRPDKYTLKGKDGETIIL